MPIDDKPEIRVYEPIGVRFQGSRLPLSTKYLPSFTDRSTELRYLQHCYATPRTGVMFMLALGIALFIASSFLVGSQLPPEFHSMDNLFRWFLQVPVLVIAFLATGLLRDALQVERVIATAIAIELLSTTALLWMVGIAGRDFYYTAGLQIMVFGFFLLSLRFKVALFALGVPYAIYLLVMALLDEQAKLAGMQTRPFEGPLLVMAAMVFGAYRVDISRRSAFASTQALNREYQDRLLVQQERNKWLENISNFLKHELKNSLIGVSSSIELIRRKTTDTELEQYLDRAETSTRFIRRLMDEASESTSLEATLQHLDLEQCDLSELLFDRKTEYAEIYPQFDFVLAVKPGLYVTCDVHRMVQAIDKLVNNAVEHGDAQHPIFISLHEESRNLVLKVVDRGDPLGEEIDKIFDPFFSLKNRTAQSGFGLGLYVARLIFEAHGGSVQAKRLEEPPGAEFVVLLPRSTA